MQVKKSTARESVLSMNTTNEPLRAQTTAFTKLFVPTTTLLKKGGKFLFMETVSGTVLVGDIQDNMFVNWLDAVNWPS